MRKFYLDIDGVRYPRDNVSIEYASNNYLDQFWDPKLTYKEYVGEKLLGPFIKYTDMKNIYPLQAIDLRFQFDQIITKKLQFFEENRGAAKNAKLILL